MIRTFGKTFALRSTVGVRISSFATGRYANARKEEKSSAVVCDRDKKKSEKFNPRSLTAPMTFKQWKMHGPRLYEKRLRFLMKAGNVSV